MSSPLPHIDWGLRDYGLPPSVWGGDGCEHEWEDATYVRNNDQTAGPKQCTNKGAIGRDEPIQNAFCRLCGAWRGCLGLEPTPDLYVQHLVEVMREVRRVLRDDGTVWLNLGDSYAAQGHSSGRDTGYHERTGRGEIVRQNRDKICPPGLKPKDLIGIPWTVALALRDDGWWLRSAIVWAKGLSFCDSYSGSVMPESVQDRPTSAYEFVFLLSKSKTYYYDQEAVREASVYPDDDRKSRSNGAQKRIPTEQIAGVRPGSATYSQRNLRNVWCINPYPFPGAHFATFPPALVEPCIKAGTSEAGCCPSCGAPWERVSSVEFVPQTDVSLNKGIRGHATQKPMDETNRWQGYPRGSNVVGASSWEPSCDCSENNPVPATVLDPFFGAGTTGVVARNLARRCIGIELSEEYCEMALDRLAQRSLFEMTMV